MKFSHCSRFLGPILVVSLLASCGGGSSSSPHYTSTAAAPTWTTTTEIGVHDDIVIQFDESIDTGSLSLSGPLADLVASQTWSRTTGANDTLTLAPPEEGWYSGMQDLTVSVQDRSGSASADTTTFAIRLKFDDFQAASVVIGQTGFTGKAANQGGAPAADTLSEPAGDPMVIDGRLWVADAKNNRLLGYDGIPAADGASASWVIGQTTFSDAAAGTSASTFMAPVNIAYDGTSFFVSDYENARILIHDGVPLSPPGTASHVIGQVDLDSGARSCGAASLKYPDTVVAVAGKLIVSDLGNNRILIWNTAPTTANGVGADIVLGQLDFDHCTWKDDNQDGAEDLDPTARTLMYPAGIWSDGTRLLVADSMANRVLIWNSFPTSSFQPADIVLGQDDMTDEVARDDDRDNATDTYASARTLYGPNRIWSNGLQIFVTDQLNNRVLVWNSFPTSNFEPADVVLGQATFAGKTPNDDDQNYIQDATPTARTMHYPFGIGVYRNRLLVSETGNHRVLVFESR